MAVNGRIPAVLLICLLAFPAEAHLLNMTRVTVVSSTDAPGELIVEIDLGQSLLSADAYWTLAGSDDPAERKRLLNPVLERLDAGLSVSIDGRPVARSFTGATLTASSLTAIRNPLTPQMATLRWRLPANAGSRLDIRIDDDLTVPWPCLVRSDSDRRELPFSRLLTEDRRSSGGLPLTDQERVADAADPIPTLIGVYAFLGLQHIVPLGLDHVLFVLGLFFVGGGRRHLLALVSCFTLAHTLTLAASTLGVISLPATLVEPLIAASIVYVGIEGLFDRSDQAFTRRRKRFRYGVVFAFGLLHGLGFASVLNEVGLPADRFLLSLLSFNIGVELGQLLVLASAFAVFGLLRHRAWYANCVSSPAVTIIAGVGLYWMLQRLAM